MTRGLFWRDARAAAQALTPAQRRLLLLLVRLPFAWVELLEQLNGLNGGASIYRTVEGLRERGQVGMLQAPLRPGHTPRLLYLTDLGLATVALDGGVEPTALACRGHVRGEDLLDLAPGLPHLVAAYELLGALAASQAGTPNLLAWERPWRRRYRPVGVKSVRRVEVPAYTALTWGDSSRAYLLVPDLGLFPLVAYRRLPLGLVALRQKYRAAVPPLLVAAPHAGRADGWQWLLEDVSRRRREGVLPAVIATWEQVRGGGLTALPSQHHFQKAEGFVQQLNVQPLNSHQDGRRLPRLVNGVLAPGSRKARRHIGRLALDLTPADRTLLDFIGRHPFLSVSDLEAVMNWTPTWANRRCKHLRALGLLRFVKTDEVGDMIHGDDLVELTAQGVTLLAGHLGLSIPEAIRYTGLTGGGPTHPLGARENLLQNLAHTLGVNAVFISLYRTAQQFRARGSNDAVVEWRNAAACAERHIRPDGYGVYRHAGVPFGFFLEYDRATMNARDYRAKFARYYTYRDRSLYKREYTGMPTILVVTQDNAAEERIATAARAVGAGRVPQLPLLLTCQWRVSRDLQNAGSLLGEIWREPRGDHLGPRYALPELFADIESVQPLPRRDSPMVPANALTNVRGVGAVEELQKAQDASRPDPFQGDEFREPALLGEHVTSLMRQDVGQLCRREAGDEPCQLSLALHEQDSAGAGSAALRGCQLSTETTSLGQDRPVPQRGDP